MFYLSNVVPILEYLLLVVSLGPNMPILFSNQHGHGAEVFGTRVGACPTRTTIDSQRPLVNLHACFAWFPYACPSLLKLRKKLAYYSSSPVLLVTYTSALQIAVHAGETYTHVCVCVCIHSNGSISIREYFVHGKEPFSVLSVHLVSRENQWL